MFNTAVSSVMELVNALYQFQDRTISGALVRETAENLLKLLAPFAPHITEELWHRLFPNAGSVHQARWPQYDEAALVQDEIEIVLQINGKVRGRVTIPAEADRKAMEEAVMALPKAKQFIEGKMVVKIICVPKKLVNIVVK